MPAVAWYMFNELVFVGSPTSKESWAGKDFFLTFDGDLMLPSAGMSEEVHLNGALANTPFIHAWNI